MKTAAGFHLLYRHLQKISKSCILQYAMARTYCF